MSKMKEKWREQQDERGKTGWPPGMLQDDSHPFSKWLSEKPGARYLASMVAKSIQQDEQEQK